MFSLIVPVYRNEASIASLLERLEQLNQQMAGELEAVLVVDGSPDRSLDLLAAALPQAGFTAQLLVLSRNFGPYPAISAGLACARGDLFAVMAADLQEPAEFILEIREMLATGFYDVVVGTRAGRQDPWMSRLFAFTFWQLYRLLVQKEIPAGGVDVFGCTRDFKEHLLALPERNTTLVGLIFWLGFRRGEVSYHRQPRQKGKSAWSFWRKLRYMLDSTFAFSDLPVRLLSGVGILGLTLAVVFGSIVLIAKFSGNINVPGYSAIVLLIMFFGGLNSLGLGLIGEYVWRAFENTKSRPTYIIARRSEFKAEKPSWNETSQTRR
jgi:glycosyltransferase involved in cell wall biosynthesis